MRRALLIFVLPLLSACVHHKPPVTSPPPVPTACIAPLTLDSRTGQPVASAQVYISTLYRQADANGYAYLAPLTYGPTELDVYADGYVPTKRPLTIPLDAANPWACDTMVHLTPVRGPRPTRAQTLDIKANFLSIRDSQNRIMFSWFLPFLSDADQADWIATYKKAGVTHVVLCPVASYPGYWAPGGDVRGDAARFSHLVSRVLDAGLLPIVMLTTGDAGTNTEVDTLWPGYVQAFRQLEPCLLGEQGDPCGILVPGFEIGGPCSAWSAAAISHAFTSLHSLAPSALIGYEACPERFSGASHPVQPDDPWQGAEAGFWTSHGGEFVSVFLYETPHGPKLLDPNGAMGGLCHLPEANPCGAWEDRWVEGLQRLCTGGQGWRMVPCSFFEVTGSDYKSGGVSDDTVLRINDRALRLCQQYGAVCTWGNGVPDQPR